MAQKENIAIEQKLAKVNLAKKDQDYDIKGLSELSFLKAILTYVL